MHPNREFHPVSPESVEAAIRHRDAERAASGLTFDGDRVVIRKPCPIVVMPLGIARPVDERVAVQLHLERLERRYGKDLVKHAMECRLAAGENQ